MRETKGYDCTALRCICMEYGHYFMTNLRQLDRRADRIRIFGDVHIKAPSWYSYGIRIRVRNNDPYLFCN